MSSQAVPTNSRVSWLDLGRVIAMFAVIGIHYASPDFHAVDNTASSQWLLGTFWMSFLKGEASTLFFMISGALLLPHVRSETNVRSRSEPSFSAARLESSNTWIPRTDVRRRVQTAGSSV